MTTQKQESGPAMPTVPAMPATVSRRVRGLLAEEHVSQREFAMMMGLSKSGVARRLADEMDFGLGEIERAAHYLGTSAPYLLGFTNDRSPATSEGDEAVVVRHQGLEPRTR